VASLKIVFLGLAAAITYGILHDQVTARLCVEYFTVAHPRIIASQSPALLGFAWGVVATWWVGLPLGVALAVAARSGHRSPLGVAEVRSSVVGLLLVMALCAIVAGFVGQQLAVAGQIGFPSVWAAGVTPEHRPAFIGVWWAHNASYDVGILGGLVLCIVTYWRRGRRSRLTSS